MNTKRVMWSRALYALSLLLGVGFSFATFKRADDILLIPSVLQTILHPSSELELGFFYILKMVLEPLLYLFVPVGLLTIALSRNAYRAHVWFAVFALFNVLLWKAAGSNNIYITDTRVFVSGPLGFFVYNVLQATLNTYGVTMLGGWRTYRAAASTDGAHNAIPNSPNQQMHTDQPSAGR